jgi:hypothetical protein
LLIRFFTSGETGRGFRVAPNCLDLTLDYFFLALALVVLASIKP